MILRKLAAVAAGAVLLFAGAASAQAPSSERTSLYLDGGYSYFNFDANNSPASADVSALTLRGGFQATPIFGLEGELSAGIDDNKFNFDASEENFNIDLNNNGNLGDVVRVNGKLGLNYLVGVYGRAVLPVTDRIGVFARAGWAYADIDATTSTPFGRGSISNSDDGFSAGAGATFNITDNWRLRADYTWYDFKDVDTQAGTVTIGYRF